MSASDIWNKFPGAATGLSSVVWLAGTWSFVVNVLNIGNRSSAESLVVDDEAGLQFRLVHF